MKKAEKCATWIFKKSNLVTIGTSSSGDVLARRGWRTCAAAAVASILIFNTTSIYTQRDHIAYHIIIIQQPADGNQVWTYSCPFPVDPQEWQEVISLTTTCTWQRVGWTSAAEHVARRPSTVRRFVSLTDGLLSQLEWISLSPAIFV